MGMKDLAMLHAVGMLAFMETNAPMGRSKPMEINAGGGQKNMEAYYLKKGIKKYIIGDKEIWARDRKNAERKAKKS